MTQPATEAPTDSAADTAMGQNCPPSRPQVGGDFCTLAELWEGSEPSSGERQAYKLLDFFLWCVVWWNFWSCTAAQCVPAPEL